MFAATIFISAFLLFEVQPLIAKQILPWFGGSAAVWTTCMLFFQVALLLGYAYAHAVTRSQNSQRQAWLHIGLLALSVFTLPIIPSVWWKPAGSDDPLFSNLRAAWRDHWPAVPAALLHQSLAAIVALAYLCRRCALPAVRAFEFRFHAGAVELSVSNRTEAHQRTTSLELVGGIRRVCVALRMDGVPVAQRRHCGTGCRRFARRFPALQRRSALADACGVRLGLVTGGTNHLSQNVASIPFLWILPLALYLLSFILCFESSFWYRRILFLPLFPIALGLLALNLFNKLGEFAFRQQIAAFAGTLFVCCMVLHGELARIKPAARFLTGFYLMTAVGGAIGGLFVAFIAPRIFNAFYEFPISIVICALAVLLVYYREQPAGAAWKSPRQIAWLAGFAATVWLAVFLFHETRTVVKGAVLLVRNFYGALRVNDEPKSADQDALRELTHGTINHGEQFLDSVRRHEPTTYYGPRSGIGLLLRDLSIKGPLKVGVVGLGTGTIAAYGKPGDTYRYYEINPLVIDIARSYFYYLADSPAKVETVLGDARLSMERESRAELSTCWP